MQLPERKRVHRMERILQQALDMPDLVLLWNERIHAWQVAVFQPNRRYPPMTLWGAETCENPEHKVPYFFLMNCMKSNGEVGPPDMLWRPDKPTQRKAWTAIEPSDWLIEVLRAASTFHDPAIPDKVKRDTLRDPGAMFDWIQRHNDDINERLDREEAEDFMRETLAEFDMSPTHEMSFARNKVTVAFGNGSGLP